MSLWIHTGIFEYLDVSVHVCMSEELVTTARCGFHYSWIHLQSPVHVFITLEHSIFIFLS